MCAYCYFFSLLYLALICFSVVGAMLSIFLVVLLHFFAVGLFEDSI